MRYGYFDDKNKEYVITTPRTPYPWINYLGNLDFLGLISQTGGGYSFYKDARFRRILRYRYNNTPVDNGGRYFYLNDGTKYYSLTYMPVKADYEKYECHHGLGYTSINQIKDNIESKVLYMIPLNDNVEIHRVTLKNLSTQKKTLTLFSFIEFCLWDAYNDMTNYQRTFNTGEVLVENNTIFHITEYRERRNHFSFYNVNTDISGFDTDLYSFLGMYNGLDRPDAVLNNISNNSIAHGWNPIASHSIKLELNPNEEKELIFLLGYIENTEDEKWTLSGALNKSKGYKLIEKYNNSNSVNTALIELKSYWDKLLSKYTIKTNDPRLDRMVNIWNPYQCMTTFNMSRSASYFESGIGRGLGFRDSNQDLLGFVHLVPDRAKQRLLDIAATQREDGSAYHQYQPLTKKGNNDIGSGFNDDPLWLIVSTIAYIKETGDFSILKEIVPYDNSETRQGTLLEHLEKSFNYTLNNLGPHNLPLIGRADWNDCLNLNCFSTKPEESFQTCANKEGKTAESIFIAGLFVYAGKLLSSLYDNLNMKELSNNINTHIEDMIESVKKYGYDGEWFLRAYDYFGNKIGSKENDEGKIFIEPQGMCIIADIGIENGMAEKALNSVNKMLNTEYGLILQTPPYTKYKLNLGEISSYPPGYKENSGIFCHVNPWIMIAEAKLKRNNEAFEYYKKIAPSYIEDISDIHKLEPYVYAQMIAGKDAKSFGEAKNSWLTGTAAWNYEAITKWILGIRPDFDGLIIDPSMPDYFDTINIKRSFRNSLYDITIKNIDGVNNGKTQILVDGVLIEGNKVPIFNDNTAHKIEVVIMPYKL